MERTTILEKAGSEVEAKCGCEWDEIKKTVSNNNELEEKAKAQNINVRDSLFGCRSEGFTVM